MHKSLVLTEALSIPEKINYLASNDYNNYTWQENNNLNI